MICQSFPLENAAAYARYSSDLQDSSSIDGQIRKAHDWAEKNGFRLIENNYFVDEAISGTKEGRPGLDQMLAAAEQGKFAVLIVESLSRLARSHVYASTVMMQLVYVLKIRIVGLDDGCDTNTTNWELLAGIKNILNEQYIRDLGKMVYRGQVENLMNGYSIGDWCFGYDSIPAATGEILAGRNRKTKMKYVIDEKQALWVRRVFDWFVNDQKPISWIAKEMTRLGAPKDRRATTTAWHHASVQRLLTNAKYVGIWTWGEKYAERNPINGKTRYIKRSREEVSKHTRLFPNLRLIDDELFSRAQELLRSNKLRSDHSNDVKKQPVKHLLSNLVRCGICGGAYRTGGGNGQYMYCRNNRLFGTCGNRTLLRYAYAEKLIVREIESKIVNNKQWIDALCGTAQHFVTAFYRLLADQVTEKTNRIEILRQKIERLLDQIENGCVGPEIGKRLSQRRNELTQAENELRTICRKERAFISAPCRRQIGEKLTDLARQLVSATPAEGSEILQRLLGGPMTVIPRGVNGKSRKYLQGIVQIHSGRLLALMTGMDPMDLPGTTTVLAIDFRTR